MGSNKSRRNFFRSLTGHNQKTVKLLTPDGELVEVNAEVIAAAHKKKVNNEEIKQWSTRINSEKTD